MTSRLAALGLITAALLTSVGAAPASASTPTTLTTRQVCAQSLYVRATAAGVIIGTLYYGDNFAVDHYSPSRQWVYGHAYGNVHQDGWVQNGWFC
ncbi:hypothetical protein Lfu02_04140 [Longispora fulva]|uniref:SH3 domain-containing protein n=1 Tax=Longispora fulva TaxID=619741 RepID=A0A8J7GMD2_9ACTN|nr:hypothetical protein [Longispora fulva]MBG6135719.1 hypothetical protein [Longispora fulva]GIG56042.1 hypothetical protein Lfu02_04140 [Longispora fulva]